MDSQKSTLLSNNTRRVPSLELLHFSHHYYCMVLLVVIELTYKMTELSRSSKVSLQPSPQRTSQVYPLTTMLFIPPSPSILVLKQLYPFPSSDIYLLTIVSIAMPMATGKRSYPLSHRSTRQMFHCPAHVVFSRFSCSPMLSEGYGRFHDDALLHRNLLCMCVCVCVCMCAPLR